METTRPPLIEVTGLGYAVEGRCILDDVTIEARQRRIGIVGRNGSGKTTLARLLAGLVAPSEGTVRIDGCDMARDRRAALGMVGILFQNPDHQILFPTVGEELAFGLVQQGNRDADVRVREMLDRFGKGHWHDAAVHGLSQGQRQLVCLMAVLVMAPRVIVLDEPLSGLDIPTTRALQRYLDGLPQTLVHVSHDPTVLTGHDRVIWLEEGRIAGDGAPGQVLPAFTARMERIGADDDLTHLAG